MTGTTCCPSEGTGSSSRPLLPLSHRETWSEIHRARAKMGGVVGRALFRGRAVQHGFGARERLRGRAGFHAITISLCLVQRGRSAASAKRSRLEVRGHAVLQIRLWRSPAGMRERIPISGRTRRGPARKRYASRPSRPAKADYFWMAAAHSGASLSR